MKSLLKTGSADIRKRRKLLKKPTDVERKEHLLSGLSGKHREKALLKYYKKLPAYRNKWKMVFFIRRLKKKQMKGLYFNFLRWVLADILSGKRRRKFGIYQFVALPGEGKTISMVAHMERYIAEMTQRKKVQGADYIIATNFGYAKQDYHLSHWTDIVSISKDCYRRKIPCVMAVDEIHITFDSANWKDFPPEMLAVLSFNRKFSMQFLCSSQIYERIPKKIRDIANFTVICKNVGHFDRLFRCYYFPKSDYEESFNGKRKSAKMIREFVADDDFYALYDTLEQVERMTQEAEREKELKEQAFRTLFGDSGDRETDESGARQTPGPASGVRKLRESVKCSST